MDAIFTTWLSDMSFVDNDNDLVLSLPQWLVVTFGCEIITECWLCLWEWLFGYNISGRRTHESTRARMNRDRQCCFTVSRHACHISSPAFGCCLVGVLVGVLCFVVGWLVLSQGSFC